MGLAGEQGEGHAEGEFNLQQLKSKAKFLPPIRSIRRIHRRREGLRRRKERKAGSIQDPCHLLGEISSSERSLECSPVPRDLALHVVNTGSWQMPIIPAPGKQRQKDQNFGCIVTSRPIWAS